MERSNDSDIRAVREMVEEIRTSIPPDLDWNALERRTLDAVFDARQLAASHRSEQSAVGRTSGMGASLVFALAAAALVMVILGQAIGGRGATVTDLRLQTIETLPTMRASQGTGQGHLATGLAEGARVLAPTTAERLVWPGVAALSLEPGAVVRVVRQGAEPHLELEHGTVQAEVTSREDASAMVEAFVLDVGGVRVAVHGTSFSVAREAERVLVEVTEGVVTVGPSGQRGPTIGTLLRGPSRASFLLANGQLIEELPMSPQPSESVASAAREVPARASTTTSLPSDEPAPRTAASAAVPHGDSSASTASPRREEPGGSPDVQAPAPPSKEGVKLTLSAARALLVGCLSADLNDSDPALRVTVSSEVRLRLGGDGDVTAVRFDPPLRPDLQERCGGLLYGMALDAPSETSFEVDFKAR